MSSVNDVNINDIKIKDEWSKSNYRIPTFHLLIRNNDYLIVISETNRLFRCLNRNKQIISIERNDSNEVEEILLECNYYQGEDLFVYEKIYPLVFEQI